MTANRVLIVGRASFLAREFRARNADIAREDQPSTGIDVYGANKARIERELQALLGPRLAILRPGNVVGYEPIPGRGRFAAYLQNQLAASGTIRLTVSPATRRDLVPIGFFCRVVREVALREAQGIFNVGAGEATEVGQAARWLIDGYGSGEILANCESRDDEFQLDTTRLLGLVCPTGELEATLRDAGRRLAAEHPRRP